MLRDTCLYYVGVDDLLTKVYSVNPRGFISMICLYHVLLVNTSKVIGRVTVASYKGWSRYIWILTRARQAVGWAGSMTFR